MRILHVITSLRMGGAEKLMVDLLPRLKAAGHDVELLLFDGTNTPFRQDIEAAGIRVHDLGVGGSVYSPLRLIRLIPFLKRYDVIHTHNTAPQLFAAIGSVLCSVVLCTTEHNTSNRRRGWRWYTAVDRWMYSRYKSVICISEKTEFHLKNHIGSCSSRIVTIHNGIDICTFISSQTFNYKNNYPSCKFAVVQVAGFRYQKDQDTTIRAIAKLSQETHLFLVGDGDRRKELELLVANLNLSDRVHFMGICSNVAEILKGSDLAVMSSHWEGFGLAAVEAMAVGIPTLASDVDGLREVVDGAGILFPHQDAETLAREILQLEENPDHYKAVAAACYNRAQQFDISEMAANYSNLYNSL